MNIDRNLRYDKQGLLSYFRHRAQEIIGDIEREFAANDYKKKTAHFNKAISDSRDNLLDIIQENARTAHWHNQELLECILMVTYASDVVMLETRNSIWEYEYMSFSRRIGELWEPLCKLCFKYPTTHISSFVPPLFSEVKHNLHNEITSYIDNLDISRQEKAQLFRYYEKVWNMVSAGDVKLECDLHFTYGRTKYIVDFKSGFGSNEKGNTNRLLLVGSIYKNIENENFQCLLFVRSTENNHYLNTLQNSGIWETYCGAATYEKIELFTGFDINGWISHNVDWMNDFSEDMKETIRRRNLENYLIW